MATRFYMHAGVSSNEMYKTVAFDSNWEQTSQASRGLLIVAGQQGAGRLSGTGSVTIPITTTQDILLMQFLSYPLDDQTISGTVSCVIPNCNQASSSNNATLAVSLRLVASDAVTVRGTLFSVYGTDTAWPVITPSSRIVNAQTLTSLTAQSGDRLVWEVGVHASAPTASGSASFEVRDSSNGDAALTSSINTTTNGWMEISQNLVMLPHVRALNSGIRPHPFSPGLAR